MLRLTWLQPEDLLAHELRQAAEDGRDPTPIATRWQKAGGTNSPTTAGASPTPAPPHLRRLATDLLTELTTQPSELATTEPTDWPAIQATWPPTDLRGAGLHPMCDYRRAGANNHDEPALDEAQPPTSGARGTARPATTNPALDHSPTPPPTPRTYESAWLGRAVGCLLRTVP